MLFFRQIQHLLPRATAWRLTVDKMLTRVFVGISEANADVRDFIDAAWLDLFPSTTRELPRWEQQFGLTGTGTESERRLVYAATWAAQGGQSPRYLQDVLQAAGFPVYVHEWWEAGSDPPVARDPHDHTFYPQIGSVQCDGQWAHCTDPNSPPPVSLPVGATLDDIYPQCNRFLMNDPGYLVNRNLTRDAPPPVPDDADAYPYFLYIGGATFPNRVSIAPERREEFERLLLKLRPAQQWIVTLIDYE